MLNPEPDSQGPAVLPEITAFLREHPEYGSLQQTAVMPDWAKGERQQVNLTSGNYLFYLQVGQVDTFYKYGG